MKAFSIMVGGFVLTAALSSGFSAPDDKKGSTRSEESRKSAPPDVSNAGGASSTTSGQTERGGHAESADRTRESTATATLSNKDRQFVMKAASGGMMEVEAGKLAQQNASSEDVKQFGERMVTDHGKANDELKQVATSVGITIPADMSPEHKSHLSKLQNLKGDAFDRAYVQQMVKDHKKDVSEFQKASEKAQNEEIKGFAAKTLPTLREHLQEIQSVHAKMEGSSASREKSNQ
jgi:putative membrane protein